MKKTKKPAKKAKNTKSKVSPKKTKVVKATKSNVKGSGDINETLRRVVADLNSLHEKVDLLSEMYKDLGEFLYDALKHSEDCGCDDDDCEECENELGEELEDGLEEDEIPLGSDDDVRF